MKSLWKRRGKSRQRNFKWKPGKKSQTGSTNSFRERKRSWRDNNAKNKLQLRKRR